MNPRNLKAWPASFKQNGLFGTLFVERDEPPRHPEFGRRAKTVDPARPRT